MTEYENELLALIYSSKKTAALYAVAKAAISDCLIRPEFTQKLDDNFRNDLEN